MKNKYSFWSLLKENVIEIPTIQRDYAQGREEESRIRDSFLKVLHRKIENEKESVNLDFVYGRIKDGKLIPLDGQQRLTTLFLLHWYLAVRDVRLDEECMKILGKFTYETRISSREFCKALAGNKIDFDEDNTISSVIEDKNWFYKSWKKDPTIKSMLVMLDAIHKKFRNSEGLFEKLISNDNPPITFDFLPLNDFNLTDELYIKMNARGKPLTDFENFKSNFVKLLDDVNASKLDNSWTDLFWKHRTLNKIKDDGYYYIDDKFLNFFTNFTINLGLVCDKLDVRKNLDEINIMDIYHEVYEDENNLQQLVSILDKLCDLNKNEHQKNELSLYFDVFIEKNNISSWDRARFYAFGKFVLKADIDSSEYGKWKRITRNIIENYNIDSVKRLQDTLRLIDNLSNHVTDLYEYIISDDFLANKDSSGIRSLEFQQAEEQLKAKLIIGSADWEKAITEVESHPYLNGHVGFLIEMADADLNKFRQYYQRFNDIFEEDRENFSFQRALLAKGDYLVGEISPYRNRSFCSFETSQRNKNDNWKQVFHNKDKRAILKELLDDDRELDVISGGANIADWRNGFVKYPKVLQYCKQYQIRMSSENDILILSKERIYGEHAEYYTYSLYCSMTEKYGEGYCRYHSSNSTGEDKYISVGDIKITYRPNQWFLDDLEIEYNEIKQKFNL